MQPEVNTDAGSLSGQDSTETEASLEHAGDGFVKDSGPAAFATHVFLVGSEMAIGVVQKQPFFC
jgi:hypothetical protein